MTVEMIYTSAPMTLDGPGYGVVAKSDDLPGPLEKFMRQLNRYDYPLSSDNSSPGARPFVYSHALYSRANRSWHVLSRAGYGGLDYTMRDVFLAHHVAVMTDDLRDSTVTGLMQHPSLFQERWDGHVGSLPKRSLPSCPRGHRSRGAWARWAGHPDWARAWLDLASRRGGEPIFLILPEEADALALYEEALELLPPSEASRATFLTRIIADWAANFDWIGLTAGNDLAHAILSRSPDRVLDLSRPRIDAPEIHPARRANSRHGAATAVRPPEATDLRRAGRAKFRRANEYRLAPVESSGVPDSSHAAAPPPPPPPQGPRWRSAMPVAVCVSLVGVAAIGVAALGLGLGKSGPREAGGASKTEQNVAAVESPNTTESPTTSSPTSTAPAQEKSGGAPSNEPQQGPPSGILTTPAEPPIRLTPKDWVASILARPDVSPLTWVTVLEIEEKDIPASPLLTYQACKGSGLESAPRTKRLEEEVEGIEIRVKEGKGEPLAMRVRKGHGLEILRPGVLDDDLLDRLPLGVLKLTAAPKIVDEPLLIGLKRDVHISLAPALPAVPFFSATWKMDGRIETGAYAFLKKVDLLRESGLEARIRADRVSLSFLPNDNIGWLVGVPDAPAETTLDKELARPMEVSLPDGTWKVTLKVVTHLQDMKDPAPDRGHLVRYGLDRHAAARGRRRTKAPPRSRDRAATRRGEGQSQGRARQDESRPPEEGSHKRTDQARRGEARKSQSRVVHPKSRS